MCWFCDHTLICLYESFHHCLLFDLHIVEYGKKRNLWQFSCVEQVDAASLPCQRCWYCCSSPFPFDLLVLCLSSLKFFPLLRKALKRYKVQAALVRRHDSCLSSSSARHFLKYCSLLLLSCCMPMTTHSCVRPVAQCYTVDMRCVGMQMSRLVSKRAQVHAHMQAHVMLLHFLLHNHETHTSTEYMPMHTFKFDFLHDITTPTSTPHMLMCALACSTYTCTPTSTRVHASVQALAHADIYYTAMIIWAFADILMQFGQLKFYLVVVFWKKN